VDRAPLAGDEREAVRGALDARPYLADPVVETAGLNVLPSEAPDLRQPGLLSLGGKPVGQPVLFARDVVVDLLEAQRFEPARGSRAEVSYVVPAVDDDRPRLVQAGRGGGVELLEGDAARSRNVLIQVLGLREYLDELSAAGE
jgi:hypothetical protein